jgi:hypothetical protein
MGEQSRRKVAKGSCRRASSGARDELQVVSASKKEIVVEKRDRRAEFLKAMEQFHWPAPKGYKFDRDEANER